MGWTYVALYLSLILSINNREVLNDSVASNNSKVSNDRFEICPKNCNCTAFQISCKHSNLSNIPEFVNLQIIIYNLSFNKIVNIPNFLSKFRNLEVLILDHNKIVELNKVHLNLDSLRVLNLSDNYIASNNIQIDTFSLLKSLSQLDLSNNPLKVLDVNFFKSTTLKILNMKNCSVSYFPKEFLTDLPKLEILNIAENPVKNLYFINSDMLLRIDATNCRLETINLQHFPNLLHLTLSGNRINPTKFVHEGLQYLFLEDNGIKFIQHDMFESLPELKYLDLSRNVFIYLNPEIFDKNTKLHTLIISNTYLKQLTKFNSSSLTNLDLSRNEIQYFESDSLIYMPHLQYLSLHRNLIRKLPDKIYSKSLLFINLSICQIGSIKEHTFANLPNLKVLDLSNNRLTTINPHFLPKILIKLRLGNNLWRCDCFSKDFKIQNDFLNQPSELVESHTLICDSPDNLVGLSWKEACNAVWDNVRFEEDKQPSKLWFYLITIFVSMALIICGTICLRRVHQMKLMQENAERLQQRLEAQERINRLRRERQRELRTQQNAPDPRELVRPPSYNEAIRMTSTEIIYPNLSNNAVTSIPHPEPIRRNAAIQTTSPRETRTKYNVDVRKHHSRNAARNLQGNGSTRPPKNDRICHNQIENTNLPEFYHATIGMTGGADAGETAEPIVAAIASVPPKALADESKGESARKQCTKNHSCK